MSVMTEAIVGLGTGAALVFSRLSGFVVTSPWPGSRVGMTARLSLVFGLSAIAVPLMPASMALRTLDKTIVPVAITEVMIGLLLGFVLRVMVSAGDVMGELVGQATGLGSAQLYDPHAEGHETAIGRVVTILAVWILLAVGAHRVALEILLESFRALPIGTVIAAGNATHALADLAVRAMNAGASMALPVIAISLVIQLALAMIARAAPSLQVFNIGYALLIGGGMLVFVDILPDTIQALGHHFASLPTAARRVFDAATAR